MSEWQEHDAADTVRIGKGCDAPGRHFPSHPIGPGDFNRAVRRLPLQTGRFPAGSLPPLNQNPSRPVPIHN